MPGLAATRVRACSLGRLRSLGQRPEVDLGQRDAAGVVDVQLEVVALILQLLADGFDDAPRERAEFVLRLAGLGEQRDPGLALVARRLLGDLKPVAALAEHVVFDFLFGPILYAVPGFDPPASSCEHAASLLFGAGIGRPRTISNPRIRS